MAKKKSGKKTTKVRNLPVRKGSSVKGGSSVSNVVKGFGDALKTAAQKG